MHNTEMRLIACKRLCLVLQKRLIFFYFIFFFWIIVVFMLLFVCIGGIHCYDVFRMNNNAHAAVRSVSRMELKNAL